MKTIIVGSDFSAASLNASKYAALLAQKMKCKLTVFNLFDAPIVHSNTGLYGLSFSAQKSTSYHRTVKLVKQLQELYPKLKIESFVSFGDFKEELKKFVDSHQVAAAVMGLEAKSRISKFIYGSHGVDIAGKIDCPVIIVPSGYKKHKLSRVLLAVDNKEKLQASMLKELSWFIKQSASHLALLHVKTEQEILNAAIAGAKINGKTYAIEVIKARDIQNGVKRYSHSHDIDLVTIISKKHSVFYDFFLESTTKKMAFAAKVPVMSLHS